MEALRSRRVRFPLYTLAGFAVAALLAWLFEPHYLSVCNRINANPGVECTPISTQSMIGLFLIGLGLVTMLIVPIVASITHMVRHGYDWETSRVETATSNLPILAGLIYFATGAAIAIAGYG